MPEVRVEDLGPGPSAEQLLLRADGRPGLVCLRGRFAGGCPVLTSHPTVVLPPGAAPPVVPIAEDPGDAVGGGWFGVFGFDPSATRFAFHDHVVRLVGGRWRFEALWTPERADELGRRRDEWAALVAAPDAHPRWTLGRFGGAAETVHLAAVERAVELIRAGELYQVNVCTRLTAAFGGSTAALFAAAAATLDPAFGAYLAGGAGAALACLSPELFLRRRGRRVRSEPIKGTLPDTPGARDALRRSAKDVAENVMIVDLVRNDLGRVCETGSVRAPELLTAVPRVGVVHLVSTVTGSLRPGLTDTDLLAATFPPGSVTGAPKLRALRVIDELEAAPRGAYTGAVGFVSPVWGAEFAVAIRTLEIADGRAELGVGGGVTADSVPVLEWRECLHKAAPVVTSGRGTLPGLRRVLPAPVDLDAGVFETLLVRDGVAVRAADHLARLDRSVRELFGEALPLGLGAQVAADAAGVTVARARLRVTVRPGRPPEVSIAPAGDARRTCDAVVVARAPGCWRHKWADRAWAQDAERIAGAAVAPAVDRATALIVAEDGTVLETTRGNVFLVEADGVLVTPPLRDDLLPGVTRRALLDLARDAGRPARLRPFGLDELLAGPAFWTSSVSGMVAIHRVDGAHLPRADGLLARLRGALDHTSPAGIHLFR